jgi:integrase/recombinase XerC
VSSTIYATNFGYDISVVGIILQSVTVDGNTLIVKFASDLFVLQNNGTDFVLKQKMDTSFNYVSLSDDGLSNASINRKIASLKSFYKFLLKTKQIETSPLLKHKALKAPKKLQIPFSEKELDLVLNQINYTDDFDGIRDKLIVDLFYTTGIRRTELIHLKSQNIDLYNKTIKVLGKRNKERIIPILPIVADQIKLYLTERSQLQSIKDLDYFFLLLKGVKLNDSFVYRIINYYFSNVSEKVKKSPHILRHTFATHLLNNGADINSVKELLGHSSLASTQVYTHSSLAELKKVYGNAHPRNTK